MNSQPANGNSIQVHLIPLAPPGELCIGGRRFNITKISVQPHAHADKKEISLEGLSDEQMRKIATRCQRLYDLLHSNEDQLEKVRLTFTRGFSEPTLLDRLAQIFSKYRWKPEPLEISSISTTKTGGEEKTEKIDSRVHADQEEIKQNIDQLAQAIRYPGQEELDIISYPPIPRSLRSSGPNDFSDSLSKDLSKYVTEAGSAGNRCAALSIAHRELERHNENLQEIITKYALDQNLFEGVEENKKKQTLSDALIKKAIQHIKTDKRFKNDWFNSILVALNQANQVKADRDRQISPKAKEDPETEEGREAIIGEYTELIRQDGEMLDWPLFLALNQPCLILQRNTDGALSYRVATFQDMESNLTNAKEPHLILYNGVHYQPICLPKDKETALLERIKQENKANLLRGIRKELISKEGKPEQERITALTHSIKNFLEQHPGSNSELVKLLKIYRKNPGQLPEESITAENIPLFL